MPTFEDLKLKLGQLISPEWYDRLVEHLTNIAFRGAVTYYGDVYSDLRPHPDLALNLGLPDLRFKAVRAGYGYFDYGIYPLPPAVWYGGVVKEDVYPEVDLALNLGFSDLRWLQVHSGYGYFSHDLYARGYRVLTEVDPITIERDLTREPILLGQKFNYLAPDFADVFAPDLAIQRTGRVRAQFTLQSEAISYLKAVPAGTAYEIISALAGASYISPYAWHEFDLTVQKDDGVNVRFSPSTMVSVRIYNIGST